MHMHVCGDTLAAIARFNRAIQYSETAVIEPTHKYRDSSVLNCP